MMSMTGFGRGAVSEENFSVSIELKTVNNRFLDVNLRLPAEMQQIESLIKRLISERLARGRVEVNLQYDRSDPVEFDVNGPLITGFLAAMHEMRKRFSLSGEPDINVIARLPNVVNAKKQDPAPEFLNAIERSVSTALDDLEAMRRKEGHMLAGVLDEHLNEIASRLPAIEAEASKIGDEYVARLTKRISEILAKAGAESETTEGRIAQEAAILADRADISEEISRLKTHIEHFRSIASEEKDVGKRLDFLTQEFNREANTIASKTNNMTVKENALAIKSEIEKIREQVQNIE